MSYYEKNRLEKILENKKTNLNKEVAEVEHKNLLLSENLNFDFIDTLARKKFKVGNKDEILIKLNDILIDASTSESFSQMRNLMKNLIPMMLKKEEGGLQAKYYYKIMQSGDVGVFIQALSVGDPKAIKLWPKVEKIIKKNLDSFYKEDIKEKLKRNTERNKMLMMLGKYGKKLKV